MNILHHKSWHVRNKDNIQRVRRDEEKAAAEEREKQRKIALAEQEARTDFLRQKARKRLQNHGGDTQGKLEDEANVSATKTRETYGVQELAGDLYSGGGGHINFFKEAEEGVTSTNSKNKDHEAEKKAEKEKWEKTMGILTYLGQSSSEASGSKPWYVEKKRKTDDHGDDYEEQKRYDKQRKIQDAQDPLHQMTTYLHKKSHKTDKEKHKKHKKKHRHRKESKGSNSQKAPSSTKTMEQLRAERLKREREEKNKTSLLMAKVRGESVPSEQTDSSEVSDRDRKYNSQYNPDFVRRTKHR